MWPACASVLAVARARDWIVARARDWIVARARDWIVAQVLPTFLHP
jgi:hypothetical protein